MDTDKKHSILLTVSGSPTFKLIHSLGGKLDSTLYQEAGEGPTQLTAIADHAALPLQ